MKNVLNFRLLFFGFIAFMIAIMFGWSFLQASLLHILLFSVVILGLIFVSILKQKLIQVSMILIFFAMGFFSFYMEVKKFDTQPVFQSVQTIEGRVKTINTYTYSQKVLLEQVFVDGQKIQNISLYISNGELAIADKITFETTLTTIQLFHLGEFSSYYYLNHIGYTASIKQSEIISSVKTSLTLQEVIRQTVYNTLTDFMAEDSANLAYSSLFGDRTNLDYEISFDFRASGISHILSVSGMHVAFLVLLLNLFLKKLNLNPKIRLLFFTIALGFYAYLCNFNTTVIRATIMSLVLLSASAFGKQYDLLNSLGLAGILLLLFNPLSALDVGFQLSFVSVFIIAILSPLLKKVFLKAHLPNSVASTLSIIISVQLGILPIIAKYFGQISILSVISNLLSIPLFELAYLLNFTILPIVLIFPFMGFLLTFVSFIYQGVIFLASVFANLKWSVFTIYALTDFSIILFYIAVFAISSFVMISPKQKWMVMAVFVMLSLTFTFAYSLPANYENLTIMQINSYSTTQTLIIDSSGQTTLIGDLYDLEYVNIFLEKAKISHIDNVIQTQQTPENFNEFARLYGVKYIYQNNQTASQENLEISYLTINSNKNFMLIKIDGHKMLFANQNLSEFEMVVLDNLLYNQNINIIFNQNGNYEIQSDFIVDANSLKLPQIAYNNLNNWHFEIKNGRLKHIGSIH